MGVAIYREREWRFNVDMFPLSTEFDVLVHPHCSALDHFFVFVHVNECMKKSYYGLLGIGGGDA